MRAKRLTVQQRREIFRSLVEAQDTHTMSVADSKRQVIEHHQITDDQLEDIVDEGVEKEWPPLNEVVPKAG